jgi:hypothetical protein
MKEDRVMGVFGYVWDGLMMEWDEFAHETRSRGKERKGKQRKGKERKGKEGKGKEGKGKERKGSHSPLGASEGERRAYFL